MLAFFTDAGIFGGKTTSAGVAPPWRCGLALTHLVLL